MKERLSKEECFQALELFDCLKMFEDYMRHLETKDIENDRMQQEKLKRRARKAREQFRVRILLLLTTLETSLSHFGLV